MSDEFISVWLSWLSCSASSPYLFQQIMHYGNNKRHSVRWTGWPGQEGVNHGENDDCESWGSREDAFILNHFLMYILGECLCLQRPRRPGIWTLIYS